MLKKYIIQIKNLVFLSMKFNSLYILITLLIMSSCNNSNESDSKIIEGKIIHSVYFWLNDSDNKEDVKTFETAVKKLMKNSQFANKMHLGKPANTEKREVIDNSYSYCLIFTFDTYKDQRIYQDEPAHLIFIGEAKHLWKKVLVFDSIQEPI